MIPAVLVTAKIGSMRERDGLIGEGGGKSRYVLGIYPTIPALPIPLHGNRTVRVQIVFCADRSDVRSGREIVRRRSYSPSVTTNEGKPNVSLDKQEIVT